MFAIAASNGSFLAAAEDDGRWHHTQSRDFLDRTEAVAVDWLSRDVVIRGYKPGTVKLWDVRINAENTEPRIRHRRPLNHVKRIDDNVIVVAGLRNEVSNVSFA